MNTTKFSFKLPEICELNEEIAQEMSDSFNKILEKDKEIFLVYALEVPIDTHVTVNSSLVFDEKAKREDINSGLVYAVCFEIEYEMTPDALIAFGVKLMKIYKKCSNRIHTREEMEKLEKDKSLNSKDKLRKLVELITKSI